MRLRKGRWYTAAGRRLAMTLIAIATARSAGAQEGLPPEAPAFRADSRLVLVPVAVVDRRGAIVNGLASNAFTLTENGVRQQIRSFSVEDVPVSMGIVLDPSGSMKGVLGAAKESLQALMKDANPADEAFLNTVSTRPRAYSGFTHEFDQVLSRVAFENAGGDTALIDTIYDSLKELRAGIHARKALVVISDGMDNHSRYSKQNLLDLAVESDAQIYTIAVANPAPYSKAIALTEERQGRRAKFHRPQPHGHCRRSRQYRSGASESIHDRIRAKRKWRQWAVAQDQGKGCRPGDESVCPCGVSSRLTRRQQA
jgi:Ca-activated chloride channel family protein